MKIKYIFINALVLFSHVQAANLFNDTEYARFDLPEIVTSCYENNNCPDISIIYPKTSREDINQVITKDINNIILYMGMMDSNDTEPERTPYSKPLDSNALSLALRPFIMEQWDNVPNMPYRLMIEPNYLGHYKNLEQFVLNTETYTGGAHGNYQSIVYVFSEHQQLYLKDILIQGQEAALTERAKQAWIAYGKEHDAVIDDEFFKDFPFTLTENFIFGEKGLILYYQPYEIAPWVFGGPQIIIPYQNLTNILKQEYLP